jgi:hypothetical protein
MAPERRQTSRSITSAAQLGGAARTLTTNTARRQSSAKASIAFGMATNAPSRKRPTHPRASHRIPSPSVGSFGLRAFNVACKRFLDAIGFAAAQRACRIPGQQKLESPPLCVFFDHADARSYHTIAQSI